MQPSPNNGRRQGCGKKNLGREDNVTMDLREVVSIRGNVFIQLRIGIIGEPLWYGIEPSGSISLELVNSDV